MEGISWCGFRCIRFSDLDESMKVSYTVGSWTLNTQQDHSKHNEIINQFGGIDDWYKAIKYLDIHDHQVRLIENNWFIGKKLMTHGISYLVRNLY